MKKLRLSIVLVAFITSTILFGLAGKASAACSAPTADLGKVTGTFTIGTAGQFRVWSRIMAPDTTNNSFILDIDGTQCGIVVGDSSSIAANTWKWVDYSNGATATKINSTLTAGTHTYTMYGREDGVKVDKVIFASDMTCVPQDSAGSYGTNCQPGAPAASPNGKTITPGSGTITDSSGSMWTVTSGGVVQVDGANAGFSANVTKLLWYNGKIYQTNSDGGWWSWDGSTWMDEASNPCPTCGGDAVAPSVPSAVTAGAKTSTSIGISWTASTDNVGVTGYKVYKNNTLVTTLGLVTSYNFTGLTASTTYNLQVTAIDSAGNESAKSTALSVATSAGTVTDNTAPSVPAGLNATSKTTTSIVLGWTASTDNAGGSGLASYKVYKGTTLLTTVSATNLGVSVVGLTANTSYSFQVSAVDAAGNESAKSTTLTVSTNATAGKIGDFDNNGAVDVFDLSRLLAKFGQTWSGVEDLDGNGTVNVLDLSILLSKFGK